MWNTFEECTETLVIGITYSTQYGGLVFFFWCIDVKKIKCNVPGLFNNFYNKNLNDLQFFIFVISSSLVFYFGPQGSGAGVNLFKNINGHHLHE